MTLQLTPTQYALSLTKLQHEPEAVVTVKGNSGTVAGDGVSLSFSYDGVTTLTVTTTSKPWYMPQSLIDSHISDYFA